MFFSMEDISTKYRDGRFKYSDHAAIEQDDEEITDEQLDEAIGRDRPKIIERYTFSCLILGWADEDNPLHTVIALGTIGEAYDELIIVTVYRPDLEPQKWDALYETRA